MSNYTYIKSRLVPMPDNTSGRIVTHNEWMMTKSAEEIAYMNNLIQENINWRAACIDAGHFIPNDPSITSDMVRNIDHVLPDGYYFIINEDIQPPYPSPAGFPEELQMAFFAETRQKNQRIIWKSEDLYDETGMSIAEWQDVVVPPSE